MGVGGGLIGVGDLLVIGVPWARLPEEVHPCSVFPLDPMYADPMCRHPGYP